MSTATAPGKIILFGEHAVVYGRPALAVPVTEVYTRVEIANSTGSGIWIEAPDIQLHAGLSALASDHPIGACIRTVLNQLNLSDFPSLGIRIKSTIPIASGLGSGTAVSVALIRALSAHFNHSFTNEEISALAFGIEQLHHGTPSGIDNTVITYGQPVYFVKGSPIETFHAGAPFTLLIGDTGIQAPTKISVAEVRKLWDSDHEKWEAVFDEIGKITQAARNAIAQTKWVELGELMNRNHTLLRLLGVSSPELDRLVDAARAAGALGAKLSGGGRGGNMIALVNPEMAESVDLALVKAGAINTIITRIESSFKE